MKTEVKEIEFYGGTLLGVKDENGQVWLAVRKCCLDIGLSLGQTQKQITNIQNDVVLESNCCYLATVQMEGKRSVNREQLFISEKVVTLWLAKITLTDSMKKKSPLAYDKLIKYQLEAANVLHKAFYETEEQKSTFHNRIGLEGRIEIMTVQINNMESILEEQREDLKTVMENMTLSTRQQQKLYHAAKDRINHLLGGAHSGEYKLNAKSYFINLWNGLKELYGCASYKDLNPIYYDKAFDFISEWEYTEA